ncbi:hypothetical protein AAX09_10265 (plasmid) [Moraxella bovoculi]|uniref:hypothetical protein n=1 Tax=Moraxella bovoculi TaxID=386891 RepID=UPI0006245C69|nr:hypothetical protein [Moraxella bovoculi]AKG19866.1 hypothetical protein AAX09_10265 [Moraxella bovoculi]
MTTQNQLVRALSKTEFDLAASSLKIQEKSRKIAYDVTVNGLSISSAARKYHVSAQWVVAVCKRIIDHKDSDAVRLSVDVPAPILSQAKQLINGLKTAYRLGQSQRGAE